MKKLLIVVLVAFLQACNGASRSEQGTMPVKDSPPGASSVNKLALWQNPSFFRGAGIHPYTPYGEEEGRVYATVDDFKSLRNEGANVITLNYPSPFRAEAPFEIDEEALKYLDDAVNWAEEVGLYVIIHFRNGPGKSEGTFSIGDEAKDETLWYSKEAQDQWVEMWRFVADRYKTRAHVVAYNLMVEPHPETPVKQGALPADVWNDLAKRITEGIRQEDQETPIIVGATVWSNPVAFADLKPTGDTKTIYSFHMYEPFQLTHQGLDWAGTAGVSGVEYPGKIPSDLFAETRYWDKSLLQEFLAGIANFRKEHGVPIFVGEFGCNRRVPSCVTYLTDLIDIFEERGWSHAFYVWRDHAEFDYQKGVTGDKRTEASEYMKIFKNHWQKNKYFAR